MAEYKFERSVILTSANDNGSIITEVGLNTMNERALHYCDANKTVMKNNTEEFEFEMHYTIHDNAFKEWVFGTKWSIVIFFKRLWNRLRGKL